MTRLGVARFLCGLAAIGFLLAMTWIGETRIAPAVPEGLLLQTRVFGYDTHDLARFAGAIREAGLAPLYRATLLWLDTGFILCVAVFTVLALWPHRATGIALAGFYAATDFLENFRLISAVDLAPAAGAALPEPGTMATAGVLTSQKYLILAVIAGVLIHKRLTERDA